MARNYTEFKAVILAGGSGERFWPLSTPARPKQFLNVFGGESLIRQSVSRLSGLVAPENVYVVTAKALLAATRRELPMVPAGNVVGEPDRRDTGAAVALAAGLCGDGVMGVFSSDQMVGNVRRFQAAVRRAIRIAEKREQIVTLGITPTCPATLFGYVDPATGRFVEKPDCARASEYLRRGYLWNAGMFIGRVETFRRAFMRHAPALAPLCGEPDGGAVRFSAARLRATYARLARISFDYAVMEKLSSEGGVAVVPCDCGWDDVGGYGAFDRYFPHDSARNVVSGDCTLVDAAENICVAKGSPRVALLGVKGLIVISTPDGVLVADKSRAGDLKRIFAKG